METCILCLENTISGDDIHNNLITFTKCQKGCRYIIHNECLHNLDNHYNKCLICRDLINHHINCRYDIYIINIIVNILQSSVSNIIHFGRMIITEMDLMAQYIWIEPYREFENEYN